MTTNATSMADTTAGPIVTVEQIVLFIEITTPLCFFIQFSGIFLNSLCIRTYLKMGLNNSVTICFFFLSIFDLWQLVFVGVSTLLNVLDILMRQRLIWIALLPSLHSIFSMATRIFVESSILLTVFLAIQRCACVIMPLHFREIFTCRRTYVIAISIFVILLALHIGVLLQFRLLTFQVPFGPGNATRIIVHAVPIERLIFDGMYLFFGIILNVGTQVFLSVCVLVMAKALMKSVRFRNATTTTTTTSTTIITTTTAIPTAGSQPSRDANAEGSRCREDRVQHQQRQQQLQQLEDKKEKDLESGIGGDKASSGPKPQLKPQSKPDSASSAVGQPKEMKAIVQVALVCTIYLTCNSMRVVVSMLVLVEPALRGTRQDNHLFLMCLILFNTLENINASVNFFVYYNYNSKFRELCFEKKFSI